MSRRTVVVVASLVVVAVLVGIGTVIFAGSMFVPGKGKDYFVSNEPFDRVSSVDWEVADLKATYFLTYRRQGGTYYLMGIRNHLNRLKLVNVFVGGKLSGDEYAPMPISIGTTDELVIDQKKLSRVFSFGQPVRLTLMISADNVSALANSSASTFCSQESVVIKRLCKIAGQINQNEKMVKSWYLGEKVSGQPLLLPIGGKIYE